MIRCDFFSSKVYASCFSSQSLNSGYEVFLHAVVPECTLRDLKFGGFDMVSMAAAIFEKEKKKP